MSMVTVSWATGRVRGGGAAGPMVVARGAMGGGVVCSVGGEGAAVVSWVMVMLVGALQVVCPLVAPLVLPVWRVLLGMLWAVVSSVVQTVRVTQAVHRAVALPFVSIVRVWHWLMVGSVCAVGGATGGGGAGEGATGGATDDGVVGDVDGEGAAGDVEHPFAII